MDICELTALKAEYEREVIFAQAKVSVIEELIARTEAKIAVETTEPETYTESTTETY